MKKPFKESRVVYTPPSGGGVAMNAVKSSFLGFGRGLRFSFITLLMPIIAIVIVAYLAQIGFMILACGTAALLIAKIISFATIKHFDYTTNYQSDIDFSLQTSKAKAWGAANRVKYASRVVIMNDHNEPIIYTIEG